MIGSFEPYMDVNDLAELVVNETGIVDLSQHCMCHFAVLYRRFYALLLTITFVVPMLDMVMQILLRFITLLGTSWMV